MGDQPRYASLRDYLALLRRQRLVVIGVTLLFAGVAFLLSTTQEPRYEAESTLAFRSIAQDVGVLGINVVPESSAERASIKAEAIRRITIARRVQRELRTNAPPEALLGAITTRVEALTNLVLVQAAWDDPDFAARLANEFAEQAAVVSRRQELAKVDAAIDELRRQIRRASDDPGDVNAALARQKLAELEAVRAVARPAEVSSRADPPAAPVSPRPVRNTLLGALVGLAFGLLAAFLRDSLDRRLRAPKDAHEELGYPVLGRVGAKALGGAGLAGNGSRPLNPADLEAFRMLRTNLAFFTPESPLRSVLVTSGIPDEGKSTVAASLASASAAAGQRTLLVEADLRRPALAERLGLKQGPGLSEYLAGTADPQEILQVKEFSIAPQANGGKPAAAPAEVTERSLVCITAGRPPAQPAELLASDRCRQFLAKIGGIYDLVVIDSSPMLSSVDPLELIPNVDGVVLCVRLGLTSRDDARAVRNAVRRLPERPTGLVVTGLGGDEEEYAYYGYEPV